MNDLRNMRQMRELAGLPPLTEEAEVVGAPLVEASNTDGVIKALGDTDYRDKDAFFKMVQLLKGLAVASEKDPKAKKFMSSVSDALTGIAKKSVSEEAEELGEATLSGYNDKELLDMMRIFYPDDKSDSSLKAKVKDMKSAPDSAQKQFVKFVESVKRIGGLFVKAVKKEKKAGNWGKSMFGEDGPVNSNPTGTTIGEMMGEIELDTKLLLKNADGISKHAHSASKDLAKGKTRMAVASLTDIVSNIQRIYTELAKKHNVLYEPKDALRRAVMDMDRTARQTAEK